MLTTSFWGVPDSLVVSTQEEHDGLGGHFLAGITFQYNRDAWISKKWSGLNIVERY